MKLTIGERAVREITDVSFGGAPNGDHLGQIDSAIEPIERIDAVRAVWLVENIVSGGLCHQSIQGAQFISIRHCMPLANLDLDEFESPSQCVTRAANAFKKEIANGSTSSPFNTR